MFAKSADGEEWTSPKVVSDAGNGASRCSWGFPLISRGGRIYVIYNKFNGNSDLAPQTTGIMAGVFSDDAGETWSSESEIDMPKSKMWDNPAIDVPPNWIVWQKPERFSNGKYIAGFTRWVSPKVRPPNPFGDLWWGDASVVEFMIFENVDDEPAVSDLEISYPCAEERALKVDLIDHPGYSVAQEPALVELPDGRLFCVMRTTLGCPYYTVSSDYANSWSEPRPLCFVNGGNKIPHPMSPCPIYDLGEGRYIFFHHNHDGHFGRWTPRDSDWHRRPLFCSYAEFATDGEQPLEFSDPEFVMDNGGVGLGINGGRADLAMYSSMTLDDEQATLWYPDRKFFLLGKKIAIRK